MLNVILGALIGFVLVIVIELVIAYYLVMRK